MKLSLAARMFAALFGVSAVMVALVVAWAGWALSDGFAVYLNNRALAGMDRLAAALEVSYARHGDWAGVAGDGPGWDAALRRQGPPPMVPDWPLKLAQAPPRVGRCRVGRRRMRRGRMRRAGRPAWRRGGLRPGRISGRRRWPLGWRVLACGRTGRGNRRRRAAIRRPIICGRAWRC